MSRVAIAGGGEAVCVFAGLTPDAGGGDREGRHGCPQPASPAACDGVPAWRGGVSPYLCPPPGRSRAAIDPLGGWPAARTRGGAGAGFLPDVRRVRVARGSPPGPAHGFASTGVAAVGRGGPTLVAAAVGAAAPRGEIRASRRRSDFVPIDTRGLISGRIVGPDRARTRGPCCIASPPVALRTSPNPGAIQAHDPGLGLGHPLCRGSGQGPTGAYASAVAVAVARARAVARRSTGISKEKRAPCPASLSAQMRPPC